MNHCDLEQFRHQYTTSIGNARHHAFMAGNVRATPAFCHLLLNSETRFGDRKGPMLHPPAIEGGKIADLAKSFYSGDIFLFGFTCNNGVLDRHVTICEAAFFRLLDRGKRVNGLMSWSDWFTVILMSKNWGVQVLSMPVCERTLLCF